MTQFLSYVQTKLLDDMKTCPTGKKKAAQGIKFLSMLGPGEGSNYIKSIVRSFILHCKRLVLLFEPLNS